MPTVLEIPPPEDPITNPQGRVTPSTPPPTPAAFTQPSETTNTLDNVSLALTSTITTNQQLETCPPTPNSNPGALKKSDRVIDESTAPTSASDASEAVKVSPQSSEASKFHSKGKPAKSCTNGAFNLNVKPPNVLIHADSEIARDNLKSVLESTLNKDKYTIYNLTAEEGRKDSWVGQTHLVVVCGNVDGEVSDRIDT